MFAARNLEYLPDLCEHKKGRDIILTFKEDAANSVFRAYSQNGESEGLCLARAATIIRKQLFVYQPDPEGALGPLHEQMAVPASLFSSIRIILEGCSIVNGGDARNNGAATAIAQLLYFNSVKRKVVVSRVQRISDTRRRMKLRCYCMLLYSFIQRPARKLSLKISLNMDLVLAIMAFEVSNTPHFNQQPRLGNYSNFNHMKF